MGYEQRPEAIWGRLGVMGPAGGWNSLSGQGQGRCWWPRAGPAGPCQAQPSNRVGVRPGPSPGTQGEPAGFPGCKAPPAALQGGKGRGGSRQNRPEVSAGSGPSPRETPGAGDTARSPLGHRRPTRGHRAALQARPAVGPGYVNEGAGLCKRAPRLRSAPTQHGGGRGGEHVGGGAAPTPVLWPRRSRPNCRDPRRAAPRPRAGSRACGTPPRTSASRRRPTPSPCTQPGRCWRPGTWTATSTCEWGLRRGGGCWVQEPLGSGCRGCPAQPARCRQVLVLLHRGGEPAALVLGASPQVVPGCGVLSGRAE